MRENIIYVALTGLLLSSLMYSFGYFRGKNLVITSTECAPCHACVKVAWKLGVIKNVIVVFC